MRVHDKMHDDLIMHARARPRERTARCNEQHHIDCENNRLFIIHFPSSSSTTFSSLKTFIIVFCVFLSFFCEYELTLSVESSESSGGQYYGMYVVECRSDSSSFVSSFCGQRSDRMELQSLLGVAVVWDVGTRCG